MTEPKFDKRPIPPRNFAIGMGLLAIFIMWRLFS